MCHLLCHPLCSEWNEFEYRTEMAVPGKPPPPAITDIGVTFIRVQWEEIKSCDGHVITYKLEMEDPTSVRHCLRHYCTTVMSSLACQSLQLCNSAIIFVCGEIGTVSKTVMMMIPTPN